MSPSSPAKARVVDAASRRIAARTLDGFKVCAKVGLYFQSPLLNTEAEAALDLYARAFAHSLEEEISHGRLPVDERTLHERMSARVRLPQRHRVRLTELHVELTSNSQTLPAVPQPSIPAGPPPSASTVPASAVPSVVPQAGPASGFVAGRGQRAESGFAATLERSVRHMTPAEAGATLAGPLRDAAGAVMLHALDCLRDHVTDPLRFVDGRVEPELRHALVAESAACVAYLLLDSLAGAGIPQKVAVVVTQAAGARAVLGGPVPGSDLGRYLALGNPTFECARRFCDLLGVSEPPELQPRLGFVLHSVRADARVCAERLRARAVRPGT